MEELRCPKCGSAALSGSTISMPHTAKRYKRFKCLKCGTIFDMLEKNV